jgi:hypothetical protein
MNSDGEASASAPPCSVRSSLRYLQHIPEEKPAFYTFSPAPEEARPAPELGLREVDIHDARQIRDGLSLDVEGVMLVDAVTEFDDYYDPDRIEAAYFPEVEALVKKVTGASRVVAFDGTLRSKDLGKESLHGAGMPVLFAHNDYTADSGPQRVRDILPDEADALLENRVAVINVWRPTRGPVEELPLAVLDAQTMAEDDLVDVDLVYPDRVGVIQTLKINDDHRWLYFSEMEASEVILLKCYDSAADGRARFTAHSAFSDPTSPESPSTRESLEVRTLAFFDAP